MITMAEIDALREEATAALDAKRLLATQFVWGGPHDEWCLAGNPCDVHCAGVVRRYRQARADLAVTRERVEEALREWWSQGCREVEP